MTGRSPAVGALATTGERKLRETDGKLWAFALRTYGEAGVPDACLALQDRCGVDVCLLLWAAWLGEGADRATIAVGDRAVGPWRARAIRPIRALRRHLRDPVAHMGDEAREAWRNAVKGLEIEAEREALAVLAGIGERRGPPDLREFAAFFGLDHGCREMKTVERAARRAAPPATDGKGGCGCPGDRAAAEYSAAGNIRRARHPTNRQ